MNPLRTTTCSHETLRRAADRCQETRWLVCREKVRDEAWEIYNRGLNVPEYDASWFRPETPYAETYQQFHHYVSRHRPVYQGASSLLMAGLILGEDAWRRRALEVALACAEAVDFRVSHFDSGMEYGLLIAPLYDGYLGARDLLRDDEEARLLQCLRDAADAILACREIWDTELVSMAFNNHRLCHMLHLLALGYVLEDTALVDPVFEPNSKHGFLHFLDGAVYDHGFCYESSLHYHFVTQKFLTKTAQIQRNLFPQRTDLFHLEGAYGRSLRNYFQAPIDACFGSMELPAVGDTYGISMSLFDVSQYGLAYEVYGDPRFALIAARSEDKHPVAALLHGPATAPQKMSIEPQSGLFPEHGYAVLVDNVGVRKQVFLTGDRSGIHHQRDGLQLFVAVDDVLVLSATDIKPGGTHGFSDFIQEDFNRCAHSHSQLLVDDRDQQTYQSPIPIREWDVGGDGVKRMAMVDEHGDLQAGIHQGRFVSMQDEWICDCVLAAGSKEHTWRLFYHLPAGRAEGVWDPDYGIPMPEGNPWNYFAPDGGRKVATNHGWTSGPARFGLWSCGPVDLQRFSIRQDPERLVHGVYARRAGRFTAFVTLMAPAGQDVEIQDLVCEPMGNEIIARWFVQRGDGRSTRLQARLFDPLLK